MRTHTHIPTHAHHTHTHSVAILAQARFIPCMPDSSQIFLAVTMNIDSSDDDWMAMGSALPQSSMHIGQKQIQQKLEKVQPVEKPSGSDAFNLTQELSSCMADSISPPTPQLEGLAQILDNLGKNTGKSVPANHDDGPELPDAKFSDLKLDDPKKQAYIEEAKNAGGFAILSCT